MRSPRGRGSGFSVIELLVCLTIVSAALLVAWDLWDESLRLMGAAGHSLTDESFTRTAIELRQDLQEATTWSRSDHWSSADLQLVRSDGSSLRYGARETVLLRCETGSIGAAEQCRSRLHSLASWRWRTVGPGLVEVEVELLVHRDPQVAATISDPGERSRPVRRRELVRAAPRQAGGGTRW